MLCTNSVIFVGARFANLTRQKIGTTKVENHQVIFFWKSQVYHWSDPIKPQFVSSAPTRNQNCFLSQNGRSKDLWDWGIMITDLHDPSFLYRAPQHWWEGLSSRNPFYLLHFHLGMSYQRAQERLKETSPKIEVKLEVIDSLPGEIVEVTRQNVLWSCSQQHLYDLK